MSKRLTQRPRLAVGLMSGTSMDGIDAALVRLSGAVERPRIQLLAFITRPYPPALRQELMRVAGGGPTSSGEISELNFLLGELFADAALQVCRRGKVAPARLAVIGSHGQTIFHEGPPAHDRHSRESGNPVFSARDWTPAFEGVTAKPRPSTFQIAEPAAIAEKTGAPVVANFRTADMAAGGQGAPLVPMVDYLLLRDGRLGSVALNIGGIANVTVIPGGAGPEDVFGFDTGPGNMVIDALVRGVTRGKKTFDAGGRLAAQGETLEPILQRMLRLPFFRRQPPKSAGREQFGAEFVKRYFLNQRALATDLISTATELTVRTIAEALDRFVFPRATIHRLIVSGGGAHNRFLVQRLKDLLPQLSVYRSDKFGLPVDAKEAIAFAVLADRSIQGLPGNLPAVTGARKSVVLGTLTRA